jgi:hypothetical protein
MTTQHNEITGTAVPEGYHPLLTTATFFEMDLIGKNLLMNGIDAVWNYPDQAEQPAERPSLFVRTGQQEQAQAVIVSLDLTDFITYHGQ